MRTEEFQKMDELGSSHWWFNARTRLLTLALENTTRSRGDLYILDLASALGDNFPICSPYGKVFGLDISIHSINFCKNRGIRTIAQGDAHHLPFPDSTFDIVVALDVLEHLENDGKSIAEISRVLKSSGKLIFNVPAMQSLYSYHDRAFHHLRRYDRNSLETKFRDHHLPLLLITYWSFFILPIVMTVRKVRNLFPQSKINPQSDFHMRVPNVVSVILEWLGSLEYKMISKGMVLPIGVSLFGVAAKNGDETMGTPRDTLHHFGKSLQCE